MSQGIFGIIDFKNSIAGRDELGNAMAAYLKRSGNGEFSLVSGPCHLIGMQRSAADSPSRQTRIEHDAEAGLTAFMHGEVNNYRELLSQHPPAGRPCRGDLDLALRMYHRSGPSFARAINGLFTVGILDERQKSVHLMNDRFGLAHQLYWTVADGRLLFATHLKTLLACPGVKRELDHEGLNLFLKYAYITSPWSILKGINKLPPGHMLTFRDGTAEVAPYWQFDAVTRPDMTMEEAVPAYRELLQGAIARRMGSGGSTGVMLSGGLDSSANAALAASCSSTPVKTFSIGFEDQRFDERPFARIVAKHFGTDHHEYTITGREIDDLPSLVWHMEEPYFELGLFLTYSGLKSAGGHVQAVIGGEGADQMYGTGGFAGGRPAAVHYLLRKGGMLGPARGVSKLLRGPLFYDRDNLGFQLRLFWNRAADLNDWYFYGYDGIELAQLYKNNSLARVPRIFGEPAGIPESFAQVYLETQIEQDMRHYVNENVMVKSGRMADMLGLVLRESFLDADVADFLVSLPMPVKRGGGLVDHLRGRVRSKLLHRKAMEGILPPEIMSKPKQGGFVPVMIFLNDPALRKRIYAKLLRSEVMGEYFRTDYISTLFDKYESFQQGFAGWPNFLNSKANRILFLLTFDIWHHCYLANDPLAVTPPSLNEYLG